jgi:hypothetical protein
MAVQVGMDWFWTTQMCAFDVECLFEGLAVRPEGRALSVIGRQHFSKKKKFQIGYPGVFLACDGAKSRSYA